MIITKGDKLENDVLVNDSMKNVEENQADDSLVLSEQGADHFSDINYICHSTDLILESLREGHDIAQLPNGDIIVTKVEVTNTQYSWDGTKNKMVKIGQH